MRLSVFCWLKPVVRIIFFLYQNVFWENGALKIEKIILDNVNLKAENVFTLKSRVLSAKNSSHPTRTNHINFFKTLET